MTLPSSTTHITEISKKTQEFLSLFPNTVYTYIPDNGERAIHTSQALELEKQALGYGIYFSVNGFKSGRRVSEQLTNVNAFFCDIDFPTKEGRTDAAVKAYKNDLVMELMSGNVLQPTAIVETKNGLHVYWSLQNQIYLTNLNPEQVEMLRNQYREIEEAILKKFDGDPGAKDIARVLRVPETTHQKDVKAPFKIKIISFDPTVRYKYAEIRDQFLKAPEPVKWATVAGDNPLNDEAKKAIEDEYPKLTRPSFKGLLDRTASVVPGMRNKALLVIAHACKESGWPLEQTYAHFSDFYGLGLREIRTTIKSAYDHNYDFGYKNEVMASIATEPEKEKLSKVSSEVVSKKVKKEKTEEKVNQQTMYLQYENKIAKEYPHLKYKMRGDFYDYSKGVYKPLQLNEVQSIILREMAKDKLLDYRRVSAVNDKISCFKSLDGRCFYHEDENPDPNILNFQNGLLDLKTLALHAHTPDYLSTVQIPIMYNREARCPQWLTFLHEITDGDEDQIKLLQQIAGYTLTADVRFSKAFILYGHGANGKSLFMRLISKLIGRENVSNVNLTALNKQFGLTGIIGKRLNLIDEISGNYFESNVIKALISGERLSAEIKFRPEPVEFDPTVKLVFSVNELPKINDTTPGLYRRFIIVPFTKSFLNKPDLDLESKLTTELTGILNWAIDGLQSLREMGRFNETEKNFEIMRVFKQENSPLIEFLKGSYEAAPESQLTNFAMPVVELYAQYRNYCYSAGYKAKSMANFSRELAHSQIDGFDLIKKVMNGNKTLIYGIRPIHTISGNSVVYPAQDQSQQWNDPLMSY